MAQSEKDSSVSFVGMPNSVYQDMINAAAYLRQQGELGRFNADEYRPDEEAARVLQWLYGRGVLRQPTNDIEFSSAADFYCGFQAAHTKINDLIGQLDDDEFTDALPCWKDTLIGEEVLTRLREAQSYLELAWNN